MKNVINIVNFIRGWDQRVSFDLKESVAEQARLAEEYNLPVTFLYQYDAMVQPEYINILKDCKAKTELGVWIECSKVLIEAVGLKWRGREGLVWDWHSCVDMTVGYTTDERRLIIDEIMRCFKELFGYYPKTVGSWALDAYSIKYMEEKYNIDAAMICKDQWGTDGYSLWGGYNSSAYYPCVNNIFCPAQDKDQQINVPVFRMLGSDPVDQYMSGIGSERQDVESMEPVYAASGADRNWVEWYLKETFNDRSLGLNYCQAGQENSFGWDAMKNGYIMQMQLFDQKRNLGEIDFELVSETARKYKETYSMTPVRTEEAHKENSSTIWYNSKYYRSNLYYRDNQIMLRDIFVFNEKYRERYFDTVTVDENLYFDNLPLIDCFRWSKDGKIGGGYFKKDGRAVTAVKDFTVHKIDDSTVYADIETEDGVIRLTFREKSIVFDFPSDGYTFKTVIYKGKNPVIGFEKGRILCRYCDFDFAAVLSDAVCEIHEDGYVIIPDNKSFEIKF